MTISARALAIIALAALMCVIVTRCVPQRVILDHNVKVELTPKKL